MRATIARFSIFSLALMLLCSSNAFLSLLLENPRFGFFYASISSEAQPDYVDFEEFEPLALMPARRASFGDLLVYSDESGTVWFGRFLSLEDAQIETSEGSLFVDGVRFGNFEGLTEIVASSRHTEGIYQSYHFSSETGRLVISQHEEEVVLGSAIPMFHGTYRNLGPILGLLLFIYLVKIDSFSPRSFRYQDIPYTVGSLQALASIILLTYISKAGFVSGFSIFAAAFLYYPVLLGVFLNQSEVITAVLTVLSLTALTRVFLK